MKIWHNAKNFVEGFVAFMKDYYEFPGGWVAAAVFFVVLLIGLRNVLAEVYAEGTLAINRRVFVAGAKVLAMAWVVSVMAAFAVNVVGGAMGGLGL